MIECGQCGGKIPPERTRASRTPTGRIWRIRAYCEYCDILISVHVTDGVPSMFPQVITDRPTISRFLKGSPFEKLRQLKPARRRPPEARSAGSRLFRLCSTPCRHARRK